MPAEDEVRPAISATGEGCAADIDVAQRHHPPAGRDDLRCCLDAPDLFLELGEIVCPTVLSSGPEFALGFKKVGPTELPACVDEVLLVQLQRSAEALEVPAGIAGAHMSTVVARTLAVVDSPYRWRRGPREATASGDFGAGAAMGREPVPLRAPSHVSRSSPAFAALDDGERQAAFARFVESRTTAELSAAHTTGQRSRGQAHWRSARSEREAQLKSALRVTGRGKGSRTPSYFNRPITWNRSQTQLTDGPHRACGLRMSAAGSCVVLLVE
jgi:hypothetical protein